jgi:hypothetical protein
MTTEFGRAFTVATAEERELLRQTARRFYAYRDRCPDRQCIAAAYTGRVREIRDIVEERLATPISVDKWRGVAFLMRGCIP